LQDMVFGELHKAWSTALHPEAEYDREAFTWLLAVMDRFAGAKTDGNAIATGKTTAGASLDARAVTCMEAVRTAMTLLAPVPVAAKKGARASSQDKLAGRIQSIPIAQAALRALAALLPIAYALRSGTSLKTDPRLASTLAGEWGLDRKLRELFITEGMEHGDASEAVAFAMAALARLDVMKAGTGKDPESIIRILMADEEARNLLGVNRWEGVEWISAEKYQRASTLMAALAVVYAGLDASSVMKTTKALDETMLAGGWCLDTMLGKPEESKT